MEKPQQAKHWKEIHRRKESGDDLNDSMNSNRSSLSSGYNRFHFKRTDESDKKSAIFQFTARNKDHPYDLSILTKRTDRQSDRRPPEHPLTPRDIVHGLEEPTRLRPKEFTNKLRPIEAKQLVREFRFIAHSLKKTIDYFSRQFRELKREFEIGLREAVKQKVNIETAAFEDLRLKLEQKQRQLETLGRTTAGLDTKMTPTQANGWKSPAESSPLQTLQWSKVEPKYNQDSGLSRSNTIKSLLNGQSRLETTPKGGGELDGLRTAMNRMRTLLSPHDVHI